MNVVKMFTLNGKKKNVSQLIISTDFSFLFNKGQIIVNDEELYKEELVNMEITAYDKITKQIYLSDNKGGYAVYQITNSNLICDTGKAFFNIKQSLFIGAEVILNGELQIEIVNTKDKKIYQIPEKLFNTQSVLTDLILYFLPNKYSAVSYSLENRKRLWNIDFKENYSWYNANNEFNHAQVQRYICVHNNIVWLSLNSGRLLGLSVLDGKILYDISVPNISPSSIVFDGGYYWIGRYHQFDKDLGKLYGLRGNFYWEIDLANPTETYEVFDISETCKKNGIRADMPTYEWPVQGKEILFGEIFESPKNVGLNNVGIFNRDTKQIVWAERIGEEGEFLPVIQKLEMQDNKLYIQDGQNTLYVYERTADN